LVIIANCLIGVNKAVGSFYVRNQNITKNRKKKQPLALWSLKEKLLRS